MGDAPPPSGVLLVGSIPLPSPEEVFKTACSALPGRLQAIPDGETGVRDQYLVWQKERFPAEARRYGPYVDGVEMPADHPGFTLDSVKSTGYSEAAIKSYEKFAELQRQNMIPPKMRFQVSLPIPDDAVQFYVRDEFHKELRPLYERRMREVVAQILEVIPAENLAIQWDIAMLAPAMEYKKGRVGVLPPSMLSPSEDPIKDIWISRLAPFCDLIPAGVPMGLHLCYGDLQHRHTIEPEGTEILKDVAQSAVVAINRSVDWIHMPVPKERDDVAYFEPLQDLAIGKTRLYLGLVHACDEEGTKKRIAAARSAGVRHFGVATECGMGRTPPEQLESILQISRNVTTPV